MSSCPACKQKLDEDARFCGHCGHRLVTAAKRSAEAAPAEILPLVKRKSRPPRQEPTKAKVLAVQPRHDDAARRETEEIARAVPEQRSERRLPLKVEVSFSSVHNFFTGFTQNASSGGLFVATYQPAAIGDTFEVSFSLPGLEKNCSATCQVRWMREYNPLSPDMEPGMGLKFLALPQEAAAGIERFFNQREPIFYDDEL